MTLHFEHVPAGQLPCAVLSSRDARRLSWLDSPGGDAAIVHSGGCIVAAIFYGMDKKVLTLFIVWVRPSLRRRGLAQQLLRLIVKIERPKLVEACVVTKNGLSFMQRMEAAFDIPVMVIVGGFLNRAAPRRTRRLF